MNKIINKIVVLYNLPGQSTTENIVEADEDTEASAEKVGRGLEELGYEVDVVGIKVLEIPRLKKLKADVVFNLVEWSGRDSHLGVKVIDQLETAGLAYTGSPAWGYMVSCDKVIMKSLLVKNGIKTPNYATAETLDDLWGLGLGYPLIAKPAYEHCAIGIDQQSVANTEVELRHKVESLVKRFAQPVIVEEYIDGLEAQVTVVEINGRPQALPPAILRFEQRPGFVPILTYDSKWKMGAWEYKLSDWVTVDEELTKRLMQVGVNCYRKLGGRSYPRVDMRVRDGEIWVLEINNNPGIDFHPDSAICHSAKMFGWDWHQLLDNIVTNARMERRMDDASVI